MDQKTKTCTRCKQDKPLESFSPHKRSKDGRAYWCKPCKSEAERSRYENDPEAVKTRLYKTRREHVERSRDFVWEYLSQNPCEVCGEADPIVLDFDHLDPSVKIGHVSAMVKQKLSLGSIMEEVSKCRVLCSNCHRRHTAQQLKSWRSYRTSEIPGQMSFEWDRD